MVPLLPLLLLQMQQGPTKGSAWTDMQRISVLQDWPQLEQKRLE